MLILFASCSSTRRAKDREKNIAAKVAESIIDYQIEEKQRKKDDHPAKKGWPPKPRATKYPQLKK